jgi:SpoVK/Ycf46/Vps4 family AAA+-type ATPase
VVLDDTLRDSIIRIIDSFIDNKEALLKGGHRHQYGILWIGLLRCGKTSLTEAIAYKYRCATYTFPFKESTLTDSELVIIYLKIRLKAITIYDDINKV